MLLIVPLSNPSDKYKGSQHRNTDLTVFANGEIIVAKDKEESRWYRARVIEADPENERVRVGCVKCSQNNISFGIYYYSDYY